MRMGGTMQVAGHVEAYVCNELRLTVDQSKRTWHFWHEGTWALKFYTTEVRRLLVTARHRLVSVHLAD